MYFELYTDSGGGYRWRLIASNGRIVADSAESYSSRQACLHGIEIVKSADSAEVREG